MRRACQEAGKDGSDETRESAAPRVDDGADDAGK